MTQNQRDETSSQFIALLLDTECRICCIKKGFRQPLRLIRRGPYQWSASLMCGPEEYNKTTQQ